MKVQTKYLGASQISRAARGPLDPWLCYWGMKLHAPPSPSPASLLGPCSSGCIMQPRGSGKSLVPCPWDLTQHSEALTREGLTVAENTGGAPSAHRNRPAHGVCLCNACPRLSSRKARQDSSTS